MSHTFAFVLILLVSLISNVQSHGRLTQPTSRGILLGTKQIYQENAPVAVEFDSEFVCRNDPAPDSSQFISVTAGQTMNAQWNFPAAHVGDCFMYLTYDADKPDAEKKWFKIKEWAKCEQTMDRDMSFEIPAYLPSSDHVIARWEWYALHVRPNIEYYNQCFDLKIIGKSNGVLPGPQVNIPGHLPVDGTAYRDGYGSNFFFTGPAVATADYVDPTSSGSSSGSDDESNKLCVQNSDCKSNICGVSGYCVASKKSSLDAGGIAALAFAGIIIVIVIVGVAFFYANKSEIQYMKPFKGVRG